MICKKCNTAVDDNEKICPSCGAKVNDNKKLIIISGVLVALVLAGIIYFSRSAGNTEIDGPAEEMGAQGAMEDNTSGGISNEMQQGQYADPIEDAVPAPLEGYEADLSKSVDDVWAMLDNTLDAVHEYFGKYSETVTFVSKNGYFYEVPSSSYVVVKDLLDLTGLESQYSDESILFFYLKPNDLKGYGDLKVSTSEELTIFVAYETKDGFAIMGQGEPGGIIAREDLNAALEAYSWNKGRHEKVAYDSDAFNEIIQVLSNNMNNTAGFDVRHLVRNSKYISAVVSPKDNVTNLSQFILGVEDGVFGVMISNLETLGNYRIAANNALPDFDLDLLPDYSVADALRYIKDEDVSEMVEGMVSAEIITNEDLPVVFSNGTSDTKYLELNSGAKFVGYFEGDTWTMYEVENYETAVELLRSLQRKPPLYILKQY